jgi:uncharacterized membrane protein
MISENKVILIISSIAAILIGIIMVQKFIEDVEFDYLLFLCFLVFLAQVLFYGNKLKNEKNK